MARLTIVGNVNLETTVRVEAFPVAYRPTTFAPFGVSSAVSGVGYNLAHALATLGNTVALASLVEDDAAANLVRAASPPMVSLTALCSARPRRRSSRWCSTTAPAPGLSIPT